jgi:hypothetical protein
LRVANMREWMLALLLIPVVNIGFIFMLWAKICIARGRSPWLAASLLVPLGGPVLIAYLAFTAVNELNEEAPVVAGAVPEGVEPTAATEENPVAPESAESFSETPFTEMPDPSAPASAIEQPSPAT